MFFKLTIFIVFVFQSIVLADENDEFAYFVDDLNTIATKTKQNIDYMPSTVTVLHSDDLTSLGVNTLYEALSFVPGIETSMIQVGWKRLIARGMHNPDSFIFDKMKLLIDGVSVSSKFYGTIYYYMDFPVDLIDRIEVLRGAASALYGDGAYNGAINVITKSSSSKEKLLNISYGSYDYRSLNALVPVSFLGLKGSIDAYFQENNKKLDVSEAFIYQPSISIFNRNPQSDERLKNSGVGVNVKNEKFDFIFRYNYYKSGNYFGFDEHLEPTIDDKFNDNINFHTQLAYHKKIDSDITLHAKAVFATSKVSFEITPRQEIPGALPFDIELESVYKDRAILVNSELEINKFENHTLLFGLEADNTKVTENSYGRNFDFINGDTENATFIDNGNIVTMSNNGFLKSDAGREHFAAYLQDLYSFSDVLMFSLNVRYDNYKRFSSDWNSRVGLVYDYNDKLTLKAQYAESFRIASFVEAYQSLHALLRAGNSNLDNEKQKSYEASFVYKASSYQILRGNLYYSNFYNTIDINDIGENDYDNGAKRESKGVEIEYKFMPHNSHELSLSYAYTNSTYHTIDKYHYKVDTPGIASHLFKAYHLFNVSQDFSINSTVSYIGSRDDNEYGSAQKYDIKPSWITNLSASYLFNQNAKFRLSVNDLFNTKVTLPSYRSKHEYLPREGRTVLASLHFTF